MQFIKLPSNLRLNVDHVTHYDAPWIYLDATDVHTSYDGDPNGVEQASIKLSKTDQAAFEAYWDARAHVCVLPKAEA